MARTKDQQREYMRAYRARKRGEATATPTVVEIVDAEIVEADATVVEATRRELATLPLARQRPADAANALRMAAILDDPAAPSRGLASARLSAILADLRHEQAPRRSALATLRANFARDFPDWQG